jgi:hypothetical protein
MPILYNVLTDNVIFTITYAGGGKIAIHINRPDPPPDVISVLKAATAIVNESTRVADSGLSAQLQQLAEDVLNSNAKAVGSYLANAGEALAVAR